MKKFILISLALIMCFTFASCTPSPEKTVDGIMNSLVNGEEIPGNIEKDDVLDKIYANLSWKIGETVKEDGVATVEMQITATDMGEVYSSFMMQTLSANLKGKELSEEQLSEILASVLKENENVKTYDVVVNLSKEDGKWTLSDDNKAFFEAISGGYINLKKDFE